MLRRVNAGDLGHRLKATFLREAVCYDQVRPVPLLHGLRLWLRLRSARFVHLNEFIDRQETHCLAHDVYRDVFRFPEADTALAHI